MSTPNTTKKLIHTEAADEKFDGDKFADKMTDYIVREMNKTRARKGLPPLKEK